MLKISRRDVFDTQVWAPAVVTFLTVFAFGLALTIIPDFSEHLRIGNKGLFFTIMLAASVVTRIFSGKASDRIGRIRMLKIGTCILAVAMVSLSFTTTGEMFIFSAIVFGVATGINSPTVFAWTVDLARKNQRAKALATMYIALEIGILAGALISAEIYHNRVENFPYAFLSGGILSLGAFVFLHYHSVKYRLNTNKS